MPERSRVGVDTGGTFTDFVRLTATGLIVEKCRSTPSDPSQAIVEGLARLADGQSFGEIVHGTTVATNAVLERKGARVALLTTEGFEDVLQIGRQTRPELYNIFVAPRRPLVEAELVFGVPERLNASGNVLVPLDAGAVQRLASALAKLSIDIVAVCLLHSYANPAHERQVAECLRRAGLRVCISHDILPEYREFERFSTTVVNASVTPLIDTYLGNLEQRLHGARLHIMQSNGGSISAAAARAQAVRTLLSGPAAGVVGARAVAREAGFTKIISFDMGGTSTDLSLVDDLIAMTNHTVIGGFPVRSPMIDIHTVGAGGGSIVTMDSGGALRVGPQSAGAIPGPACYGTGHALTVTDANLLLGRFDPDHFFGGRMTLDVAAPRRVALPIAKQLNLTVPELAEGIVRVANANMERAMRLVSVERGYDPRDFVLVAFGGAGGMHACEIARQLQIAIVIVPRYAGVLSALGMLMANVTKDYSASVLRQSDLVTISELKSQFKPLVANARQTLTAEGFSRSHQEIELLMDVRYVGQSYEITLPFSHDYRTEFDRRHSRLYGYSNPERPVEIVNLRVKASGITEKPKLPKSRPVAIRAQPLSIRQARFDGRMYRTAFYHWDDLRAGARAAGPAVITGGEATVVIPPAFGFKIDPFLNIIARKSKTTSR